VITVRVTITTYQDITYFALEDPIPAGTEAVDTSLLTTSGALQPPDLRPTYDPAWWWGWWYFDHTEMRDEQVNLYADWLPRGSMSYTYRSARPCPASSDAAQPRLRFYSGSPSGAARARCSVRPEGQ